MLKKSIKILEKSVELEYYYFKHLKRLQFYWKRVLFGDYW